MVNVDLEEKKNLTHELKVFFRMEMVELLVIKIALNAFVQTKCVNKVKLIVESDLRNALQWIIDASSCSWTLWKICEETDELFTAIIDLSFAFFVREATCLVDTLAKAGIGRSSLFLAWW